ncbi:MAG TPA: hypothetical protein VF630_08305, partial [Hymenobacter sp.]
MDNQQNQPGSPMPGNDIRVQNAGSSDAPAGTGASNSVEGGAAASARKTSARGSQGAQGAQGAASGDQATASAGSSDEGNQEEGQQASGTLLDTALQSGKKWIEDSGVLGNVNALPQSVKDWGNRAVSRVGELYTTQKIVGGALLAAGIGYLATRKGTSADKSSKSEYGYSGKSGSGYGRRNYGYQAPDATNSRRVSAGSGRTDSGSAYGNSNSGSGYGSYASGSSYSPGSSAGSGHSADKGSSFSNSSSNSGDQGSRTSESS